MNDITSCRFFKLLQKNEDDISCEETRNFYCEFRDQLVATSDSQVSYTSIFRALTDLYARIQILLSNSTSRTKKKWGFQFLS